MALLRSRNQGPEHIWQLNKSCTNSTSPHLNTTIYIFFQFLVVMVTEQSNITARPDQQSSDSALQHGWLICPEWAAVINNREEETVFKQWNKAMICILICVCMCVCVHGTNTTMTGLSICLSVCPFIASLVTGFLQAGTAAPWRWSNPPGRTAGTQKCASHRPPASSTAPSVHGARRGSRGHRASCSPSPPAPTPHGYSCLGTAPVP